MVRLFCDATPHLTAITNRIGTGESYTFGYQDNAPLASPFNGASFGTRDLLTSVTVQGLNLSHQFGYGSNNAGELTSLTLPYGGVVGWQYRSFAYPGPRTLREVATRTLQAASGASADTWSITRDDSGSLPIHAQAVVYDQSAGARKSWSAETNAAATGYGRVIAHEEWAASGQGSRKLAQYTWTADAAGAPYISSTLTTLDGGSANQKQSKVEQTLDTHGNPTQTRIYDWNSLSTPARTYTQAYLHASQYYPQYAPQRIFDRVMSSTVSGGGATWQTGVNNFDLVNTWMAQSEIDQLRYHDAAYTANFAVRGNLTTSYQPGTTKNLRYDITGTVRNAWDEKGQVEVTTAAASGFAAPTRITPGGNLNLATNGTYNSFLAPTSVTGPNGAVTGFSYDALARPSGVSSPHGATTVYTYTNGPPATRTATVTVTIPPPPFGQPTTTQRWTRTTYDGLGREVLVESGDSAGTKSIVNMEYGPCACSPLGRVKRVSQPYAPGGTVYWTVYSYDALGRTTRIDHPGGSGYTAYLYEGNAVTVTDPAGKWKKYISDVFGNLVQVTEPAPEGGQHQTYYTYDLLNHLTQVTMPRGAVAQTRSFNYEAGTHRMLSATHPESGTTTYAYNADGTLLSKTTAANRTTTYTYDGLKRVTLADRSGDDCLRTEYYYDANPFDGAYTQNAWGRIAAVRYYVRRAPGGAGCLATQNATPHLTVTEMYTYTVGGRALKKRMRLNAGGADTDVESSYGYDNEGRMSGITYPESTSYGYGFDGMRRPVSMTQYGQTTVDWVKDVAYGPAGEMTQLKQWTGQYTNYYTETRTYNARLQMTRMTSGAVDMEYRYSGTQNNGRVTQTKDWLSGEEVTYQYDALSRLARAETTGPEWGTTYGYDGYGNLLSKTPVKGTAPSLSITVDAATNRVQWPMSYDAAGNVTAMPSLTLSYDAENRLAQAVHTSNGTEQYGYAPDNKRVWKKGPVGTETLYFWGAEGQRLMTYTLQVQGTAVVLSNGRRSVYFGGRLLMSEGVMVTSDRLGSVRKREGGSSSKYYPWGEEQTATAGETDKFATYYRDGVTGLDYAQNRYYSSVYGRFLSSDPYKSGKGAGDVANPQSWSRYAYSENDPVNFVDPAGLNRQLVHIWGRHIYYVYGDLTIHDFDYYFYSDDGDAGFSAAGSRANAPDPGPAPGLQDYDRIVTSQFSDVLQKRLDRLGNCTKILTGVPIADFWEVVKKIKYYDGRPNAAGSGRSQDSVAQNGVTMYSLADAVTYDIAAILKKDGVRLPIVILGRDFYGDPSVSQPDTLLHEALHYALNLGDPDLKKYLAAFGFTPTSSGSHDISEWLKKDCPK